MAKRKKKRKRGKYVAGAVGCAAVVGIIVGLNFDGLGIGDGFGFDLGSSDSDSVYEETDDNDTAGNAGQDHPTQVVTVEGDSILFNGSEISLEQLDTLLADYSGDTWELRSERAIAAVQDDVRALLQQNGVRFTETSD